MKYCIVIIDGAAGRPLLQRGGKTSLELAHIPHLDAMAQEGVVGMVRTIPVGTEPSSDHACMSVLGYDPEVYYIGRAAIEARSIGIPVDEGDVVFRCNLVAVGDGRMLDYSAGRISTGEAHQLIAALDKELGGDEVHFYPGVSYRHICKIKGCEDTLLADCTPPHDIPDKPIAEFLPKGAGSELLRHLMKGSEVVLRDHPMNIKRRSGGEVPANMIWLFWGSGSVSDLPSFKQVYGLDAAVTSGVDVIRGLARMMDIGVLDITGVSDGLENDYAAQAEGALHALDGRDLVVIHIEATDEAAHAGSIDDKVEAIQRTDREVIGRLRSWRGDELRLLVMPDHPTPIEVRTHTADPVPFMLWGPGFASNGAKRFTESEAEKTGFFLDPGYRIMGRLVGR